MTEDEQLEDLLDLYPGLCGCGQPIANARAVADVVRCFELDEGTYLRKGGGMGAVAALLEADPARYAEVLVHAMNEHGLFEHGGSVYGCWPSPNAKSFLEGVARLPEEDA